MSRHQIPYPRWRRVVDKVWPFKGWMSKYEHLGRHEKDVLYPVLYQLHTGSDPFGLLLRENADRQPGIGHRRAKSGVLSDKRLLGCRCDNRR